MNNLIVILLFVVIIFHILNVIHNKGVHIEVQSTGIYIIWYSWEHNAFGEYYKLTHRRCIWKIQQKE